MKKILLSSAIALCTALLSIWIIGGELISTANHAVGSPPDSLHAESVQFDGVHGWFVPAVQMEACILLLHGVRADRTSMISRAQFLSAAGYTVLMIDMQAHGETQGDKITFGYRESESAKSAIKYLRVSRHCNRIVAIGTSLGGAASLLGSAPIDADALILEAVYPTIEAAITNRLAIRVGALAPFISPLFYEQIPYRLGTPLGALRPLDAIKNYHRPILIIGGSEDQHTKLSETEQLYASANAPKELWIIQGAKHQDFHRFAGAEYEQRLLSFIMQAM